MYDIYNTNYLQPNIEPPNFLKSVNVDERKRDPILRMHLTSNVYMAK